MSDERAPDVAHEQEQAQAQAHEQLVYGVHPVLEALGDAEVGARGLELLVQRGLRSRALGKAIARARALGVKVRHEPAERLVHLSGSQTHQGLVLRLGAKAYTADLEDLIAAAAAQPEGARRVLVIDQIQDPRNVGALLRSAVAFGVSGALMPRDRTAPINADAIKTSAGAALKLPVVRVTNLARALERLKEAGFWIYGADRDADTTPAEADWARPVALVLGAEGKGLRRLTREGCDVLVCIPQSDAIDSLNVAVAGGILMHAAWTGRASSP